MLQKLLVIVLLVSLLSLSGCMIATKPAAVGATALSSLAHGDIDMAHYRSHYWSFYNDAQSLVDDFDKHFLGYDRNDPFSE